MFDSENNSQNMPCGGGKRLKVAVLAGGISEERQVSLETGDCVAEALAEGGLEVVVSDIGPDDLSILDEKGIDVFFPALHGRFGEDGELQGIMESRGLCFTGSGSSVCRKAFDKMVSKKVFAEAGLKTPAAVEFEPGEDIGEIEKAVKNIGSRYVVKPVRQGSSLGVSILSDYREIISAARDCFEQFGSCMIEEYIAGREITSAVLDGEVLPVIEIVPKESFYDYRAKYIDEETEFLFGSIKSKALSLQIEGAAAACFNALGCSGFGRVDFMLSEDKKLYVLEVNTIPGLTKHSLFPKAGARAGLSMSQMCLKIVGQALTAKNRQGMGSVDLMIDNYLMKRF